MTIHRRTAGIFVSALIVMISAVFGATRPPLDQTVTYTSADLKQPAPSTIDVPNLMTVKLIQINFGMPSLNPSPLIPNTQQNRATITKVLGWLRNAKPLGYERPHPMPNLGPISLYIQLTTGKSSVLEPALNSTMHIHNGNVTMVEGHAAKNEIDYNDVRLYSPELYNWLVHNGWKQDIPLKSTR